MTTTTKIQLDQSGESQVFVATRTVRNSDHANGAIAEGERVFFRRDEAYTDGAGFSLAYAESGEPTNGSEYAVFGSIEDAEEFVRRAGLVPADAE